MVLKMFWLKGKKGIDMTWQQIAMIIFAVLILLAVLYWYGGDLIGLIKKFLGKGIKFLG